MNSEFKKDVLVIILNYNKPRETIEQIKEFFKDEYIFDILVIDNGSDTEKRDKLRLLLKNNFSITNTIDMKTCRENQEINIFYLETKQNLGYARGNNEGLRLACEAGYEFSIISNNDIKLTETKTIATLVDKAKKDDSIAWCAPKIITINNEIQGPYSKPRILDFFYPEGILYPIYKTITKKSFDKFSGLLNERYENGIEEPNFFIGCFGLFRNEAIKKSGFLDHNTFLYYEEQILSKRLLVNGYHLKYCSETIVIHEHDYKKERKSLNIKNYMMFLKSMVYYFREYENYNDFIIFIGFLSKLSWIYIYNPVIVFIKRAISVKRG